MTACCHNCQLPKEPSHQLSQQEWYWPLKSVSIIRVNLFMCLKKSNYRIGIYGTSNQYNTTPTKFLNDEYHTKKSLILFSLLIDQLFPGNIIMYINPQHSNIPDRRDSLITLSENKKNIPISHHHNIMAGDDLATPGAGASAAMLTTRMLQEIHHGIMFGLKPFSFKLMHWFQIYSSRANQNTFC